MAYSKDVVRINTRISRTLNEWLEKRSKQTGYSKSTLIMLAVENYYAQTEVVEKMGDMASIMNKLDKLESELKRVNSLSSEGESVRSRA